MPFAAMLSVLALVLPLQGAFQETHKEIVTVVEGDTLDLDCRVAAVPSGHHRQTLEWKNPKGYVIFLNRHRGLRDQRYKLAHYSVDALSITLSNVKMQDEGLYTCFYYSDKIQRKEVSVIVIAAPSQPLLEALRTRSHNEEEKIILKCSTWGSKPPPRVTWMLDNGVELFGDSEHQQDAKKYNSTSILTVRKYTRKSSFTCIIHHEALEEGNLTATLYLKPFKSPTDLTPNATEFSTVTLANSLDYTASDKIFNATEGNSTMPTMSTMIEAFTLNFNSTINNGTRKMLNATEGKFPAWTPFTSLDTATVNSETTNGTNLTYEGIVGKEPSVLLPALVTMLLVVLSIVVLLFVVKLWKAHREWKKGNDVSEQTLESNRSRPNEDNHGQEKHWKVVPWKTSKKYVIRSSCMRASKNSEGSQESSVFEKHLPYIIRETDF
ncbi:cytotoxic and regulatory T-cell molecule [Anolis sagrei]|uniref:cytotoxic and regulatory T-cell molecule n=1 Tax=Anolis sagrei TaxID=38937 RepID=UPI0035221B1C